MAQNLTATVDGLVIVGGGRIGSAIAAGVVSSGALTPEAIVVVNPGAGRCAELTAALGVVAVETIPEGGRALAATGCVNPCCILAVKPQVIPEVIDAVDEAFPGVTVASVAVGISTEYLERELGRGGAAVRVMPNTPAMVGAGVSLVSGGSRATQGDIDGVTRLFETVGSVVVIDESLQNVGAAISGSGPAYYALIVRSLEDAAVSRGLDRGVARAIASATARGTAELLERTEVSPTELMSQVSSPGGTTLAALAELEAGDVAGDFDRAVAAAIARAEELGGR